MSWELGYNVINALVVPAWALLLVLPKSPITKALVHSMLWPVLMGSIYATLLVASMFFGPAHPDAGFSFTGVQALFDHPNGLLIGWTHYLVFDLFVGAWIARDARRRDISHIVTVPCLLGAFLFGPVGLLLYAVIRVFSGHGFSLDET